MIKLLMKKISAVATLSLATSLFLAACTTAAPQAVIPQTEPTNATSTLATSGPNPLWIEAVFEAGIKHSFNVKVPPIWSFAGGGDMDHATTYFYTGSQKEEAATITDYALSGCPETNPSCNIDEVVSLTPAQIFTREAARLQADPTLTPRKEIPTFEPPQAYPYPIAAFVTKAEINKTHVEIFLVNLGTGVVEVKFNEPQKYAVVNPNYTLEQQDAGLLSNVIADVLWSLKPYEAK